MLSAGLSMSVATRVCDVGVSSSVARSWSSTVGSSLIDLTVMVTVAVLLSRLPSLAL